MRYFTSAIATFAVVVSSLAFALPALVQAQTTSQFNLLGTSADPTQYYVPGTGNPAVSTADYYHINGLYWFRPYDLMSMGSHGAAIAASKGRYFWIASPDHPSEKWADGEDFMGGFSDDPGVPPTTMHALFRVNNTAPVSGGGVFVLYQAPFLVYNPDDPNTPFYIYGEGYTNGTNPPIQHEQGLARSSDLVNWTMSGRSHPNSVYGDWSSFQRVVRVGTGNWHSIGLTVNSGHYWLPNNGGADGLWTSTDGRTFTASPAPLLNRLIGNSYMAFGGSDDVTMNGQKYAIVAEDARNADGGMYVTMVPVDAKYNVITSPAAIRISPKYDGVYPGPGYLQAVSGYVEDGIVHMYAAHGFPSSCACHGTVDGAPYLSLNLVTSASTAAGATTLTFSSLPSNLSVGMYPQAKGIPGLTKITAISGSTVTLSTPTTASIPSGTTVNFYKGGLWEQFIDYYTKVVDPVAAAQAAPVGVKAMSAGGTVTLSWQNALPQNTYRVYRGTSINGPWTSIGDVTGTSKTDSPSLNQRVWYKVVTLQNGTERKSRIVRTYASNASALVNAHIDRVLADGADPATIDVAWLTSVDNWLAANDLAKNLLFWTNPAFGVKKSGSTIQKIYDLGTTRLPRGGDYTPYTTSTTYSATGLNGAIPAWVNTTASAFGYYGSGRFNNIRRETQITTVVMYQKSHTNTATFLATGEFGGMALQATAGSPGSASFMLDDSTRSLTATAPLSTSAVHIIGGVFNGSNLIAYGDGVAGTPQTGLLANSDLSARSTLRGQIGGFWQYDFLGSGAKNSKAFVNPVSYVFENNEAQFTASDMIVFDKGLTSAQMTSLNTLLRTRSGGGTPTPVPVPAATASLSASPSSVTSGGSSTLSWSSTNATSCTGSGFTASGTSGSVSVSPSVTTTYSITCTGSGGSGSASATVTVSATPAPTPAATATLSASPASITSGNSATLSWSSTNATSCTGSGFTASGTSGSVSVSPSVTTTYSITCTGSGGSGSASATVTVSGTTPAPTTDTAAPSTPTNLNGSGVTSNQINLSWTASTDNVGVVGYKVYRNGTQVGMPLGTFFSDTGLSVSTAYNYTVAAYDAAGNTSAQSVAKSVTTLGAPSLNPFAIGARIQTTANLKVRSAPTNGTNNVLCTQASGALGTIVGGPTLANNYTWWSIVYDAKCDGWSVQDYLVTVGTATQPAPAPTPTPTPTPAATASLSASPSSVTSGGSSTLSWSSTNATSCTGSGFTASGTSGSVSVSPSVTTTYSITCTGSGGSGSASATVTVSATPAPTPAATATLSASPASITSGNSATLSWSSTNATSCTGSGFTASGTSGSVSVSPSVTTTYSITCTGSGGSGSASATVTVSASTPAPTPTPAPTGVAVVKNIKTDFGAACNGSANDNAAFTAFNTWAKTWQQTNSGLIQLDIPSGSVCMFTSTGGGNWFVQGIKKLVVSGYGATISDNNGAGNGFFLGGRASIQDKNHSARLATVAAGSMSVTLLDATKASLFKVGNWALITGLDIMGYGYPQNPQYFEYVKVTGISGTTITFEAPLKNTYKSTWPLYWAGNDYEVDQGGPATLYALDPTWDTEVEYRGLTISHDYQIYSNGRSITFTDTTFTNGCAIPSQNKTWTANNTSMIPCLMEVDKMVETMTINGGTYGAIAFQSASIDLLQMNGTNVTRSLNGTPKKTIIQNSRIASLGAGAAGYGASSELICQNSTIDAFTTYGATEWLKSASVNAFTMSGGKITVANTYAGPMRWAVPGANLFWVGQYSNVGFPFTIIDVTSDATNTYIQTSLTGGFPPVQSTSGNLGVRVHPAPKVTFTNCTGSPVVKDLSGAPAGAPVYSYSKRSYTGNVSNTQPVTPMWGKLVSVKINVTKPYTGSKSTLNLELAQFGMFVEPVAGGAAVRWSPTVNLKVAGERVVTPSAVTGGKAGDSLTAPGAVVLLDNQISPMVPDIGTESASVYPEFTIEMITDQGIVNTIALAPSKNTNQLAGAAATIDGFSALLAQIQDAVMSLFR